MAQAAAAPCVEARERAINGHPHESQMNEFTWRIGQTSYEELIGDRARAGLASPNRDGIDQAGSQPQGERIS
jgi:hypothetical protein